AAAVTLLAVLRMYQRTLAVRARQAFRASRQHSRGGLLPLLRRVIARQRLRDGIPQREHPLGPDAVRVAVLNADQLPRDLVHRNPVAERETDESAHATLTASGPIGCSLCGMPSRRRWRAITRR